MTIRGLGIGGYSITGTPSDTHISASVTIAANASNGTATVSVTSNGYGSGFQQTQPGQSQTGQANAQIVAPPAPLITSGQGAGACSGSNLAGTTQNVYVGQQIQFTACIPSGANNVTAESWSPTAPPGTAVGGYDASTASGSVKMLTAASCGTVQNCDFPAFYWVDAANQRQFTFSYTANGGQTASATLTFNVAGPTQANISATLGAAGIYPLTITIDANGNQVYTVDRVNGKPTMMLAGVPMPGGQAGIAFLGSAVLPQGNPGSYSWVQLVNSDQLTLRSGGGSLTTCNAFSGPPELDNTYPYKRFQTTNVANDTATDNPNSLLASNGGAGPLYYEQTRTFSATMYLMWSPGTANSIPVSLASTDWQFKGDAINTGFAQPNGTTFTLGCTSSPGSPGCHVTVPSTDANNGYPIWGTTLANGTFSCQ